MEQIKTHIIIRYNYQLRLMVLQSFDAAPITQRVGPTSLSPHSGRIAFERLKLETLVA